MSRRMKSHRGPRRGGPGSGPRKGGGRKTPPTTTQSSPTTTPTQGLHQAPATPAHVNERINRNERAFREQLERERQQQFVPPLNVNPSRGGQGNPGGLPSPLGPEIGSGLGGEQLPEWNQAVDDAQRMQNGVPDPANPNGNRLPGPSRFIGDPVKIQNDRIRADRQRREGQARREPATLPPPPDRPDPHRDSLTGR